MSRKSFQVCDFILVNFILRFEVVKLVVWNQIRALRLEADCDVTETEIPEDSSTTDFEDGLGCFGEGATLPF